MSTEDAGRTTGVDALIAVDGWLAPYADRLHGRAAQYQAARDTIKAHGGLLGPISLGHQYFGFNRGEQNEQKGVWYREWAPGARGLFLVGDFNDWDRRSHPPVSYTHLTLPTKRIV